MNYQQAANKVKTLAKGEFCSINEQTLFHSGCRKKHQHMVYIASLGHFISERSWDDAIKKLEKSIADRKNRNLLPAPHMLTA